MIPQCELPSGRMRQSHEFVGGVCVCGKTASAPLAPMPASTLTAGAVTRFARGVSGNEVVLTGKRRNVTRDGPASRPNLPPLERSPKALAGQRTAAADALWLRIEPELRRQNGNIAATAKALKIIEQTLRNQITRAGKKPADFRAQPGADSVPPSVESERASSALDDLKRANIERLEEALHKSGGNASGAARLLGVTRETVYNWLETIGKTPNDYRPAPKQKAPPRPANDLAGALEAARAKVRELERRKLASDLASRIPLPYLEMAEAVLARHALTKATVVVAAALLWDDVMRHDERHFSNEHISVAFPPDFKRDRGDVAIELLELAVESIIGTLAERPWVAPKPGDA
jgi:ActR/RegA family two-component response regulator